MTLQKRRKKLRYHLRIAASRQALNFHEVAELSRIIAHDGGSLRDDLYDAIFRVIDELALSGYEGDLLESNVDYLLQLNDPE